MGIKGNRIFVLFAFIVLVLLGCGTCKLAQDERTVQAAEDGVSRDLGSQIAALENPLRGRYTYDGAAYRLSLEEFHYRNQEKNTDVGIRYPVVSGSDNSDRINVALYEAALHGVESGSLEEAYNLTILGDYSITYLDEAIFSILFQFGVETPGRSESCFQGITLDVTSGDVVTLADLGIAAEDVFFSRANGRASVVDDIFKDENSMNDLWEAYLACEQPKEDFYLTDNGVGFILYMGGGYTEDVLYEVDWDR